jgi:putative transcription factor
MKFESCWPVSCLLTCKVAEQLINKLYLSGVPESSIQAMSISQFYCELCGRQTSEKKTVVIDGSIFNVCLSCSKHGKPYKAAPVAQKKKTIQPKRHDSKITMADETILSPQFPALIREARMKKGLTHEQLGARMLEKAGLLRKFETGALKPDEAMAKKLERFLGIKLYTSISDDSAKDAE